MRRWVLAVVLSALGCAQAMIEGPPSILSECPMEEPACVPMLLDAEESVAARFSRSSEDEAGYTRFTIPTEDPSRPEAIVRGYTGGMTCCAFGQATAAVVALSLGGSTTVLTSQGRVVLPSSVIVGCRGCLRVSGRAGTFVSPSWDLALTGHRAENLAILKTGTPVLRDSKGCVTLTGEFQFLPAAECQKQVSEELKVEVDAGACT